MFKLLSIFSFCCSHGAHFLAYATVVAFFFFNFSFLLITVFVLVCPDADELYSYFFYFFLVSNRPCARRHLVCEYPAESYRGRRSGPKAGASVRPQQR